MLVNPHVSRALELRALDTLTAGASSTALDLGIAQSKDEIVVITVGTLSNVDGAFIRIEESFNLASSFTEIAVLPIAAGINYIQIHRKRRYLRVTVELEFEQPDPENPVASAIPIAVALLQ